MPDNKDLPSTLAEDTLKKIVQAMIGEPGSSAAEEEVDIKTNARAVVFDDGSSLPEKLNETAAYTNSEPMPVSVGGFPAGTTFNNIQFDDMFTGLLYPYTLPLISWVAAPASSMLELGTDVSSVIFTATITKKSKPIKEVRLFRGTSDLGKFNGPPGQGSGSANFNYTGPINSDTSFTAKVYDDQNGAVTTGVISYTFINPMYIGVVDKASPTADDITSKLTKKIVPKSAQSLSYTLESKYMCISCPPGWEISTIIDKNKFDITSSFTKTMVNILCKDGTVRAYNTYTSGVTTQTGFLVTFNPK